MNMQECKVKKGKSYWSILLYDGKYEWQEYIVRSIQNRKQFRASLINKWKPGLTVEANLKILIAYFVQKVNGITWIKKSKKNGDFGWSKKIDPMFKENAIIDDNGLCLLPLSIYTTKLQAAKFWMGILKENLKRKDLESDERKEDLKDLKCVERLIKRLQNKKKLDSK